MGSRRGCKYGNMKTKESNILTEKIKEKTHSGLTMNYPKRKKKRMEIKENQIQNLKDNKDAINTWA